MNNIAFIDGQNLHRGTKNHENAWEINLPRFRTYLKYKYKVRDAYYFLGYAHDEYSEIYDGIQRAGFILKFKKHTSDMTGAKKGNVDTDIVFEVMRRLYLDKTFHKIILVSGDGDFKELVDFLIKQDKFHKILFPNKKYASSLYKRLGRKYFDYLENPAIKNKIKVYKKKRGP